MRLWSIIVLVACESSTPLPVTRAPTPIPPRPPAAVSCADAGVLLRGFVQDTKKAGPAKEAAIASACLFDKWTRSVLDCIGGGANAKGCLDKLTDAQRAALTKKLTTWAETYAETLVTADAVEEPETEPDPP